MRDELRSGRVLQAEEFDVERGGRVIAWNTGVYRRAAAEVHGDKQLSARPDAELARGYADRIPGGVKWGGNFTHHRRVSGILDVEDQDAGVDMGTAVQPKIR